MAAKSKKSQPDYSKDVTSGSNIRLESPSSERKPKPTHTKKVAKLVKEKGPARGFFDFIKEQAVVGLIIGFVLGSQVQILVKQLVTSFLDPTTQLIFGTSLSNKALTVNVNSKSATYQWGASVNAFVVFLFVLLTLYFILKVLKLEKLDKSKK